MNSVSLLASLGLDARPFQATLKESLGMVDKFGSSLLSIPSLGGVLSAAGFATALKGVIEYGAQVQHLSDRFGVTTDAIQKFGNAAEQNGVSMESVARAFNKLEVAQSKALLGDESLSESFARLGVTAADLKNLKPEEIMEKLGHSSLNAADTVALLGRNGTELRPVLKGLADGTIDYGKAINDLNIRNSKRRTVRLRRSVRAGISFGEQPPAMPCSFLAKLMKAWTSRLWLSLHSGVGSLKVRRLPSNRCRTRRTRSR
jgi:hypothetical protein